MCSIFGISFQNGCTLQKAEMVRYILRGLLIESQARGSDATGVAFISKKNIAILKNDVNAKMFLADDTFDSACAEYISPQTISIVGHCRMKTKGTEKDKHNNHPIITNNIIGVHNGIISNDEELFTLFQKKYAAFGRSGKVDSEIIFRLVDYYVHTNKRRIAGAIRSTTSMLEGSYACALVDRNKPHLLWLFRNVNPVSIYHYTKHGIIIFSSADYFIRSAVGEIGRSELGRPTEIKLPTWYCIGINLETNSMYKVKLKHNKNRGEWGGASVHENENIWYGQCCL